MVFLTLQVYKTFIKYIAFVFIVVTFQKIKFFKCIKKYNSFM